MALSSAVLEILAFEQPIFSFRTFLGPKTSGRISETGGQIRIKLQDMIAQSSVQNKFVSAFQKIVPFWNCRNPTGSGVDKNNSKFSCF